LLGGCAIHSLLAGPLNYFSWCRFPPVQWRRQGRVLNPAVNFVLRQASRRSSVQHKFFAFHSIILHTNKGQLFGAKGAGRYDYESKFSKIFRGSHPEPSLWKGGGYPIQHPLSAHGLRPTTVYDVQVRSIAGTQTIVPLRSYGVSLVPQQEQTPGVATAPSFCLRIPLSYLKFTQGSAQLKYVN